MIKRKNIIKIAIDSPAAAGAGTLAKAISKHYNLFYLDTGKIYRMIAYLKIKFPKKFNQSFIKSKIKTLKVKDLLKKTLLSDEVGTEASIISKTKSTRKLVPCEQKSFICFYFVRNNVSNFDIELCLNEEDVHKHQCLCTLINPVTL